jgi:hypothetical protein
VITVEEIRARVTEIDKLDSERAHDAEDQLWCDVLRAIAEGAHNASELAAEALKTEALDFSRWMA